ncbi:MAG: glycosyltransferase [Bryobacteraceae bacterium]|nr:glycosyltransferase [Bryobacteraceae bacterium]
MPIGGTERQVYHLATRLNQARFRPSVWCSGEWGPVGSELASAGIPVHRVRLEQQAVEWLRSLNAAIFHSMNYCRHGLDVLFAKLAGVPVIVTQRGTVRHWDQRMSLRCWEETRNSMTDRVVANSNAIAAVCQTVEGLNQSRIRVIHNGVVPPDNLPGRRSIREEIGVGAGTLLIGNVAKLRPVKDQFTLLRALRLLISRVPNAVLVVCGDGPDEHELRRLRAELKLEGHCFFAGLRPDPHEVYAGLDLYAHSSRAEGLPNAVLEAMSHSLPVVATSVGGTAEAVVPEETGMLVPPGEPEPLAEALIRLLRDESTRRFMGTRGRRRVEANFAISRMVRHYEAVYEELMQKKIANTPTLAAPA